MIVRGVLAKYWYNIGFVALCGIRWTNTSVPIIMSDYQMHELDNSLSDYEYCVFTAL